MQLVPFKPFNREIGTLEKEMENLWNRFFGETGFAKPFAEEWAPTVEVSETKDKYIVNAELPGRETKDVNVTLSDDILTIKGEKKKETEEKDEDRYFSERYYGSFQRSFQLPAGAKADEVEASFDKGVLKIEFPKKEEVKKKEIEVKVK
jgi:HSP20 family protein